MLDPQVEKILQRGVVIPAHPLALDADRQIEERRQRALSRYYLAAGAGGLAVGVHATQFEIHDPAAGLFRPVLELAAEELEHADRARAEPLVRIAGLWGSTAQAAAEAELARDLGYHAGLLALGALGEADDDAWIDHCRAVAGVIPLVGFHLPPAASGRTPTHRFWRRFAEIENVAAVNIAPFNRYQTLDVVRAVAESGREDIALYTGNGDNLVLDLLTPYRFTVGGRAVERRIVGGLLGHWAVWTKRAVELLAECHRLIYSPAIPAEMLRRGAEITDCNAAVFDAANGFSGCLAGIHEVLRRQGLLSGTWCLDQRQCLSPGQLEEIDRVYAAYPYLTDDDFVAEYRDRWLWW